MLAMIAIWPATFDLSIVASSRGPGGPCLPANRPCCLALRWSNVQGVTRHGTRSIDKICIHMGFGALRRLTLPYGRRSGWRWGFGCCLRYHSTGASMRPVAMSIASRTIPCQFPAITTHEPRLAGDGARVQCSWRAEALIQGSLSGQSKPTTGASAMNPARASRSSGQSRSGTMLGKTSIFHMRPSGI